MAEDENEKKKLKKGSGSSSLRAEDTGPSSSFGWLPGTEKELPRMVPIHLGLHEELVGDELGESGHGRTMGQA